MKALTYDKQLVLSRVKIDPIRGCWNWTRARNTAGYGQISPFCGFNSAHRFVYFLWFGVHPSNLCVCHHCDNKICVNPDHLFLGTNRDNQLDAVRKGRCTGPKNPNPRRGDSTVNKPKLTEADVLIIRSLSDTHRVIAARFGVSRSLVTSIRGRRSWSHVP